MSASSAATPVAAAAWVPVGEARSLASSGWLHVCVQVWRQTGQAFQPAVAPITYPRAQPVLQGRYISVLRIKGRLTCIDSICFHAGGPLVSTSAAADCQRPQHCGAMPIADLLVPPVQTLGDIEDIEGKSCLICPW
jgi:nitrite reductase/ring-hydroxylating ferredoxin subunit